MIEREAVRVLPELRNRPRYDIGRHVFGASALAFGLVTLVWPESYDWLQPHLWNVRDGRVFAYVVSAAQIIGGAALQFRRTCRAGAAALGAVYLIFVALCVPRIVAKPQTYDSWGNFFEQFSLASGAALAYARPSSVGASQTLQRIGRILLGMCSASFAIEQAVHLDATATLVPKWLPPTQIFWAVVTTILFLLAAASLLANRLALLATRLLTTMLLILCTLVWLPLLFSDPHAHTNWTETFESFGIAGAAWILADLLGERRRTHRPR
jgi:hypothetical protein